MRIYSLLLMLLIAANCFSQVKTTITKPITRNMKIGKSMKILRSTYKIDAPLSEKQSVIIIEGNNITVDFNNATLKGSNRTQMPDEFLGTAIVIKNSRNVLIKNLNIRGYKVAVLAMDVEGLRIENCDLSYNYRVHLNSSQEKEDISDWMSYHQNENDEWLRYGAAIYLRKCISPVINNCKVTGGQNALMMTETVNGKIYNNDFSFNSGIGIGLYRSSGNHITNNRINFNVRGYSHGIYNRGQDSAGILVYEQSNFNIFYNNSVTHSGDGFFLWAGQTTMNTGKGGCNNNFIARNDFSYAPTNGIEVTFSSNVISENRIFECDHGIWGGYSYNTVIRNNQFRNNRIGIAIEHGQENSIDYNLFSGDKEAIRLWARKEQPSDWGYAKYRDTRSRDYNIVYNSFNKNPLVLNLTRTSDVNFFDNTIAGDSVLFKIDSTVTRLDTLVKEGIEKLYSVDSTSVNYDAARPMDPFTGNGKYTGRKNIRMTQWGPYDFRYPIAWHTNAVDSGTLLKLDLIAPKGKWKIKKFTGVKEISQMSGVFPASIDAKKLPDPVTDIVIEFEYTGEAITNVFGEKVAAGKTSKFYFKKFFQPLDWEVLFFSMDTAFHNPIRTGTLFSPLERKAPVKTEHVKKIDYAWWGGLKAGDNNYPQFMTMAAAQADLQKGDYVLSVTWDDALRVYVDEKLVVDEWEPSKYNFDQSPHKKVNLSLGGHHTFRLEHLELGGFAALSVKLEKK